MSVLVMDSFDWNGATIVTNRYESVTATPTFSNAQTKHGSGYSLLLNSTNESITFNVGDQSGNTIVIGLYLYASTLSTLADTILLTIKNSIGGAQLYLIIDKTSVKLKLVRYVNTILATGTQVLSPNTWYHIEFKIKVTNSTASGECVLKIDGVEDLNLTGVDTQGQVTNDVQKVTIGSSYSTFYIDDFYVLDTIGAYANDFIGPHVRIESLEPDGNGNSNDFVGGDADSVDNYLHVDESPADDDTSYVESSTPGDKDSYTFDNLTGSVDAIMAIQTMTRHKKVSGGGSRTAKHFVRRSAADYDGDITHTLSDGTYENDIDIWVEDPSTTAQWTETNVNALEAGIKVQT